MLRTTRCDPRIFQRGSFAILFAAMFAVGLLVTLHRLSRLPSVQRVALQLLRRDAKPLLGSKLPTDGAQMTDTPGVQMREVADAPEVTDVPEVLEWN